MMLIESIFMELRTRLRSCNVYITTTVDFKKNCNLKISIQANSIILNYCQNTEEDYKKSRCDSLSSIDSLSDCFSEDDADVTEIIGIDEFCRIIPNSMSGLRIDKNNISFRILTEPKNGGNFYKELISPNDATKNNSMNHSANVDIKASDEIKIVCANCVNIVSDSVVKFDRILELPSENIDMSEWFCHHHGNTSTNDVAIELKPNKYDLLYRLSYFMINNRMLSEKTNKFNMKRNVYHCNRCLAWLGLKSKDSVKLFNSTIKVTRDGAPSTILKYKKSSQLDDISSNDFIYTIESMTKEFNLGFQYTVMCKLVLECTVSADKKEYLLIWVMDKELQVLRNEDDYILVNDERIKLVSSLLTKILYRVECSLNSEVESWLSDPGVVSSEISKTMYYNGIEHLRKMSMRIPLSFRTTNGYTVSYVKV